MNAIFRISFVVGFVIFGLVLWSIDRGRTWGIISGASTPLLAAAVALVAPEAIFKALKLRSLARSQSSCSFVDALVAYFVGIPFGAVTPGKAGDLIKVFSLSRRTHIGLPEALAIGFLDRLLDLLVLLLFSGAGALLLLAIHPERRIGAWIIGLSVVGVAALLLITREGFEAQLRRLGRALLAKKAFSSGLSFQLKRAFDGFFAGIALAGKDRGALATGLVFALLASIAISTRSYVFALALGLSVSWFYFVLLIPLIMLVELLPISILGIGTREYAAITVFAFLGLDREQAVSLSLSSFVFSLVPLALIGYLVALKEHLEPSKVRSEVSGLSR